jgi:argininosuccinate lyase
MTKLWKKNIEILEHVNQFISSDNVQLDQKLVKYDCLASIAHAHMLQEMGLLSLKEYTNIHKTLTKIIHMDKEGNFTISTDDEDVHTKIENHLVGMIGDAGLKIHTARSRNDQVLVALKLWTKDQLIKMSILLLDTASTFAALH